MQEFEQLEAKLNAASARKDELDAEIARSSASGGYEALVASTEQLATVTQQVRPAPHFSSSSACVHGAAMKWRAKLL